LLNKRYFYSAILNTNIISALNLNSHETADETIPTEDTPSSSENQLEDPGDVSFNSDGNIYFFPSSSSSLSSVNNS